MSGSKRVDDKKVTRLLSELESLIQTWPPHSAPVIEARNIRRRLALCTDERELGRLRVRVFDLGSALLGGQFSEERPDATVTATVAAPRATAATNRPPESADHLIALFLPSKDSDAIRGDLEERYNESILPRFGKRRADIWFWAQCIWALWPLLRRLGWRALTFAWAYELWLRLSGR